MENFDEKLLLLLAAVDELPDNFGDVLEGLDACESSIQDFLNYVDYIILGKDLELEQLLKQTFDDIANNSQPCDPEIAKIISEHILELF